MGGEIKQTQSLPHCHAYSLQRIITRYLVRVQRESSKQPGARKQANSALDLL